MKIKINFLNRFIITIIISIFIGFAIGTCTVKANNSVEFNTLHNDELQELFKLTAKEVTDPLKWIRNRQTYLVVERRDDGGETAWINAPTLQAYLYGMLEEVMINGYDDTITDLDKVTENSLYPTSSSGNTGLKKWGFNIPSNTYYGEWPTIKFDASALFPTQSWWSGFKSVIRTATGGNVFNDLTKENFGSLYYSGVHDYIDDYSYVKWIEGNWENVCKHVVSNGEVDYPLLTKQFCGNREGEFDGGYYTFQSCIIDQDFLTIKGTPEEFNKKLKSRFGPLYNEIMFNMIALNPDNNGNDYDDLTRYPLRVMPYEKETLMDDFDLADDPRSQVSTAPIVEIVHVDISKLFKSPSSLNMAGKISSLSLKLNGLCSLTSVNTYLDTDIINNNVFIIECFLGIIGIVIIIKVGISAFKICTSKEAILKCLGSALLTLFAGFFIVGLISSHDRVTTLFNKMLNVSDNFVLGLFQNGTSVSDFADSTATDEDLYDMIFWMPYINSWCMWNTNHTIEENVIDWNGDPELDEHDGDMVPSIGSKKVEYWFAVLIKAFTESENELDNDVYRVVDHFMAPRITVDYDSPSVSSMINENYNGHFQTRIGGVFIYSIFILIATILKVLLFFGLVYNFVFLYAYVIKEFAISKHGMKGVTNELLCLLKNIGTYSIANIFLGMICYYSSIAGPNDTIAYTLMFLIFDGITLAITINLKTCPKIIYNIREFLGI